MKSLLVSSPFSNGLGTNLLLSCVKNFKIVISNGQTWFLYSKQRLLTQHIREFFASETRPLSGFLAEPGDKATSDHIASFPGLPVFVLWFVFSIIHGSERVEKNGEVLRTLIMWMTSGGRKVNVWRAMPDYKYMYLPGSEFLTGQAEYSWSCMNVWGLA